MHDDLDLISPITRLVRALCALSETQSELSCVLENANEQALVLMLDLETMLSSSPRTNMGVGDPIGAETLRDFG